ncbi:MAG: cytochrome c maturation protein CcmE [Thermoanaerobaculia bacterium]
MSEPVMNDAPATRKASSRNKWAAVGALGVAALAFLLITVSGIGDNLVYYWTPSDLQANSAKAVGATIRLGGMVKPGSISGGKNGSTLEFDVTDYKSSVHVKSTGVPPQMFREEIGVVVEGTMTEAGYFESNRLMVSHGNEYRAPKNGEHPDVKTLMKSTEGLD